MTDLVNSISMTDEPMLSGETTQAIKISGVSPEQVSQLKIGQSAVLKILSDTNGNISSIVQTEDGELNVSLPQVMLKAIKPEQMIEINVRIGSGQKLYPLKEQNNSGVMPSVIKTQRLPITANGVDISVETKNVQMSDIVRQINVEPLKLDGFIEKILQPLKLSQPFLKQITENVLPLNMSVIQIGGEPTADNSVLQALQDMLRQAVIKPMPEDELQTSLINGLKELSGTELNGELVSRSNGMTLVETPLGKTFLSSEIKLPLSEKVILQIEQPVEEFVSEIKFLDNLLKFFHKPEKAISPQVIAKHPQLKNLADINEINPAILQPIIRHLPFQSENILENMYRFYQGAVHKDINKWLGNEVLKTVAADKALTTQVVRELNSFMSSALKETPTWRIVEMPLFDGNQFSTMKIAVKKDAEQKQQNMKDTRQGTRFIVETDFSKLGGFQFDGFSNISKRSLDLIIRSTSKLEDDFCANVINLFKKSLYNLDYSGTIKICRQQAFVNLQDENQISSGIYV